MTDWLDYQKLAASIYGDLDRGAVVTHDDKILGLNSGILRQIDVSIRADVGGHAVLVIVQAKDLSRPADLNVVGEFNAVIDDVRASKGVLICSAGFTASAITYARTLGIDLCTAHDATSRKWALDLRIPLLWIEPSVEFFLDMMLVPKQTNTEPVEIAADAANLLVSSDGGTSVQTIAQLLCERWVAPDTLRTPDEQHRLVISCDNMELLLGKSFWCPVLSLAYLYTIHNSGWKGTFTFAQCRGILNVSTGILRAKARITDKDIPVQRDPSWEPILDLAAFETANTNLLRIEQSVPTPNNLIFESLQFESE